MLQRTLTLALLSIVLSLTLITQAQITYVERDGGRQTFFGELDSMGSNYTTTYRFEELQAGDMVYINIQPFNGNLDAFISMYKVFGRQDYHQSRRVTAVPIVEAGDYMLDLTAMLDTQGEYRMYVAVNDDSLLDEKYPFQCTDLLPRPEFSGTAQRLETVHFVIHYTAEGRDRSDLAYVQEVANAFEFVWQKLIVEANWSPPTPDCGEGGDRRFDIYLQDSIGSIGALGYASPEIIVGDNPGTLNAVEQFAGYSYIVIDNDMNGSIEVMQAVVAHEFHHNIQFGYDVYDPYGGMYESGAVWIQQTLFPEYATAMTFVDLFRTPDLCLGLWQKPSDPYPDRQYNEWVMIDSLTRDLGGLEAYRVIWEHMARGDGMPAFYSALSALGTTPQKVVERMAIRNLLLSYRNGDLFLEPVAVESHINGMGQIAPFRDGVQQLGVDYVFMRQLGNYELTINQPNLHMYVIGVDADKRGFVYDVGQQGTVDTRPYQFAYVMVLNTDTHFSHLDCEMTSWNITVSDGTGKIPLNHTGETWNASNFVPTS
jgi:hypothetical protein